MGESRWDVGVASPVRSAGYPICLNRELEENIFAVFSPLNSEEEILDI